MPSCDGCEDGCALRGTNSAKLKIGTDGMVLDWWEWINLGLGIRDHLNDHIYHLYSLFMMILYLPDK